MHGDSGEKKEAEKDLQTTIFCSFYKDIEKSSFKFSHGASSKKVMVKSDATR